MIMESRLERAEKTMKRRKDKIHGAQCPDCGRMMEKQERLDATRLGKTEIVWKCTNKKCHGNQLG